MHRSMHFDTIVVGPNAFLVRDAAQKAARRLLDYAEHGGVLVVQYQGYPHQRTSAPRRTRSSTTSPTIASPTSTRRYASSGRITSSSTTRTARPGRVRRLDPRPRHVLLRRMGSPRTSRSSAAPIPDEDEKLGGLLVAGYGRGLYVYCGYTLFRQLPAGVPGRSVCSPTWSRCPRRGFAGAWNTCAVSSPSPSSATPTCIELRGS